MNDIIATSIAPSALSSLYDQSTPHPRNTVYALGDPRPSSHPFPWSELQAHTVVTLAHHLNLQAEGAVHYSATRQWLLEALQEGLIVDISTHSTFSSSEPMQPALILAKGEKLTARKVLNSKLNLRGLRLLVLSLCQTEVLDLRKVYDEGLKFAIAMLQAGAKSILTSLWTVDDRASYLLIVRFLQEWLPIMDREPPSAALSRAQRWLRSVTSRELSLWKVIKSPLSFTEKLQLSKTGLFESDLQDFEEPEEYSLEEDHLDGGRWNDISYDATTAQSIIRGGAAQSSAPDEIPYKDPVYWAGFQIMGW